MESKTLTQNVISTLAAGDTWSDGFEIFQSLEEQQLLPEEASFNSVMALLAVHNLDDRYALQLRNNAEYMSPKQGDLPFLRYKNKVVGAEDLLAFLKEKEYILNSEQTAGEQLLVLGVLSIIKTRLIPLELYCVWIDGGNIEKFLLQNFHIFCQISSVVEDDLSDKLKQTDIQTGTSFSEVKLFIKTYEKYAYDQPKHLGKILCWQKRQKVKAVLEVTGLLNKTQDQLMDEARRIFSFFSQKLESSKYVTGNTLTEADVFVYGHIQAILESKLERNILLQTLEEFPRLKNFCLHFGQLHLGQQAMLF